ncbi:MAG: hypothetical protein WCT41_00585 [Candidatus Paceibacterota bacterium]|jgi:hypothetical protein
MNKSRAYVRRFIAAHSIIITLLSVLILLFVKNWDGLTTVLMLIAGFGNICFILWLIVDAVVVRHHMKKIRMVVGQPEMISFATAFFVEGMSWELAKEDATRAEKMVQEILQRAAPFPKLDIKNILATEGLDAGRMSVERAERQAASEARAAEERQQRAARKIREASNLTTEGIALGIDEQEMHELLKDIDRARAVVAKKKHERELLERAGRYSCTSIVQWLIQSGAIVEADIVLAKTVQVIERASELGIEESVRSHIAANNLSLAEEAIAKAQKKSAFEDLIEKFEKCVEALPADKPHKRIKARALLEKLANEQQGTRTFRKVQYELEQSIAS